MCVFFMKFRLLKHGTSFPRNLGRSHKPLRDLVSRVMYYYFCCLILVTSKSLRPGCIHGRAHIHLSKVEWQSPIAKEHVQCGIQLWLHLECKIGWIKYHNLNFYKLKELLSNGLGTITSAFCIPKPMFFYFIKCLICVIHTDQFSYKFSVLWLLSYF